MKTTMQELIEKLEHTKMNSCKHLYEIVFFDGVLAIIEGGEFLDRDRDQKINAYMAGQNETGPEAYEKALNWFNEKYTN